MLECLPLQTLRNYKDKTRSSLASVRLYVGESRLRLARASLKKQKQNRTLRKRLTFPSKMGTLPQHKNHMIHKMFP